jgi:hypothetical protein
MLKRILLAAILALGIAACTKAPTQSQLQTYALAVAPVTDVVVPALMAKPNLTPADAATITKAAADIKASAQLIANNLGSAPINAQSLVSGVQALAPTAIKYLARNSYEAGLMQASVDLGPLILQAAKAK